MADLTWRRYFAWVVASIGGMAAGLLPLGVSVVAGGACLLLFLWLLGEGRETPQ
jgi:hypothetical protein